jgi:hypothetical protein
MGLSLIVAVSDNDVVGREGWKMIYSEPYKKNEVPDRPCDFESQIQRPQKR